MRENRNVKIKVPEDCKFIIDKLQGVGHEAFIVGGCVRDYLLGKTPQDWDITTSALPEQVKSLFSNTVDTGIQHGTVMVIRHGVGYEITTYRVDGEYKDGRHPSEVTFTRSLEEDLKRRDFTINAFAYNDERGLVDLFDGYADLQGKIIRAVGDPNERFNEDALRIMRAIRFAAQLGFEIESETFAAIDKFSDNLAKVSMERIRVEFEKTLMSANPHMVNKFFELGMGEYIVSGFGERCSVLDCALAEKLVAVSACETTLGADETSASKIAANLRYLLLADFLRNLSYEESRSALIKMKYDNKTKDAVSKIILHKDEDWQRADILEQKILIKKLLCELGEEEFFLVCAYKQADNDFSQNGGMIQKQANAYREIREVAERIIMSREPYTIAQLDITGKDLIAAGITAGNVIGEKLDFLLERVIEDPTLNKKAKLLEMI